ncbi:MAG: hypothetical protein K8R68_05775, partial [Bacteroidales bacterium]|nr:hypothetical protein [Bacteroidales bacterium]
ASNTLTQQEHICRRCSSDLGLLYQIQLHSYKYRIKVIQHIFNNNINEATINLKKALNLSKKI